IRGEFGGQVTRTYVPVPEVTVPKFAVVEIASTVMLSPAATVCPVAVAVDVPEGPVTPVPVATTVAPPLMRTVTLRDSDAVHGMFAVIVADEVAAWTTRPSLETVDPG